MHTLSFLMKSKLESLIKQARHSTCTDMTANVLQFHGTKAAGHLAAREAVACWPPRARVKGCGQIQRIISHSVLPSSGSK